MKHVFGRRKSAETLSTTESPLPTKEAVRTRTAMSERPCTEKNLPQRPIHLDKISVHLKCDSASSGDVTETTVSCEPSEKKRMTALTHALAGKQQDISETFCKMVYSMAKLAREAEGSSSNGEISEPIKLCKELEEQAVIMAKKQALIAQHFEATVNRLEQEAMDREAANQRLIAQVNTARRSLKDQAFMELEVISETRKPQESTPTQPPRKTIPEISFLGEDFSIEEIAFRNIAEDVVDVADITSGQHLDNATFLEDTRWENLNESAVFVRLML